jgi:parallel beta-helix repeat protein
MSTREPGPAAPDRRLITRRQALAWGVSSAAAITAATALPATRAQAALAGAATTGPALIRTPKAASPGQVLGFYGGGLAGGSSANTTVVAQALTGASSVDISLASISLATVDVVDNVVTAQLPASATADLYAMWVSTDQGTAGPVYVNRPEPHWVSDLAPYQGQQVRLFGRNFLNPTLGNSTGVSISLVPVGGNAALPAQVVAATAYTIDFVVPSAAVTGDAYVVQVGNGAGGPLGVAVLADNEAFTITALNANITAVNALIGLKDSWLASVPTGQTFNVVDYGAVGDGSTDDTTAIQSALNAAGSQGGGIVHFPAGTFAFSATLMVADNTIVVGGGPDQTILEYVGGGPTKLVLHTGGVTQTMGMANLSVNCSLIRPATDSTRYIFGYITGINFNSGTGCFLKNVNVTLSDGLGVNLIGVLATVVIEDCNINVTHTPMSVTSRRARLRGNTLTNTMRPGLLCAASGTLPSHWWIESNTFVGHNIIAVEGNPHPNWTESQATREHRVMDLPSNSGTYVGANTTTGHFGTPNDNDGEGLLWQGVIRVALGTVSSATSTTLTDTTATLTAGALTGYWVAIVSGPGVGQVRRIVANTATQVTIDAPWQVLPDTSSQYTIDGGVAYQVLVVDNNLQAGTNKGGIVLYGKHYDCVVDNNTLANTGGVWLGGTLVAPIRADFGYYPTVINNTISGASNADNGKYCVTIGPASDGGCRPAYSDGGPYAVVYYGAEVRNNHLTGIGTSLPSNELNVWSKGSGIMVSSSTEPSVTVPIVQGIIVEGNTVTNTLAGVHLSDAAYDTVLHNNTFTGNGVAVDDSGSVRTSTV